MRMRLITSFAGYPEGMIHLFQCSRCKDVVASSFESRTCDKCSDEEIPTNSRMRL